MTIRTRAFRAALATTAVVGALTLGAAGSAGAQFAEGQGGGGDAVAKPTDSSYSSTGVSCRDGGRCTSPQSSDTNVGFP